MFHQIYTRDTMIGIKGQVLDGIILMLPACFLFNIGATDTKTK